MPNGVIDSSADHSVSFRRLIRISIVLQAVVIAGLLGVTLWGTLQTRAKSDQLAQEARNVLFLTGQNQEFVRARAALREYVLGGKAFSVGAFNQSRSQITTISLVLRVGLPDGPAAVVQRSTDYRLDYLRSVGDRVIELVDDGQREAATKMLDSRSAQRLYNDAQRASTQATTMLEQRQRDAQVAVTRRQGYNAALIVASGLLILLTSVGLLFWIRRRSMVPLEDLAVASRRLGHGDLSARVEPSGVEEIALTGRAFNQMADEIERHVGQLHELSVARSRFVSSVSHELRTPITSLRGYLDLLAKGEAGQLTPEQLRFVEISDRNAHQLSELIDDLLTLSRVQSARLNLRDDPVNLRDLLHELRAEMLPAASDRGIDIVLVDTGDLIVHGDGLRLRQAFGNLLGNAIKYSREGQAVVVRALTVDRQAVISFVDWGIGIPREDLPQVAEPFFRSEANEGISGTGLGLAIAKQMVELHGGRLAVESELGSGSTFTVYLPLSVLSAGGAESGEAEDQEPGAPASANTSDD